LQPPLREISQFPSLAMRADRDAAWVAFDGDEAAMLIAENEGAARLRIGARSIGTK